jgi:hypothetical protein
MPQILDPLKDAERAIDAAAVEEHLAALQEKMKAYRPKMLASQMANALDVDPAKQLPVSRRQTRPAIDIVFCNATDDIQVRMLDVIRAGASGKDVQSRCEVILDLMAADYGTTHAEMIFGAGE